MISGWQDNSNYEEKNDFKDLSCNAILIQQQNHNSFITQFMTRHDKIPSHTIISACGHKLERVKKN
jgi:hypothetical protein